jgi:hypothetical protein
MKGNRPWEGSSWRGFLWGRCRLTKSAREPSWGCLGCRSSLGASCRDTPWLWPLWLQGPSFAGSCGDSGKGQSSPSFCPPSHSPRT